MHRRGGQRLRVTLRDGRADGNFKNGTSWQNGEVYRFDRNWASPLLMFNTGRASGGISYDTSNHTVWTSCDRCPGIRNISMAGTLLGTINTAAQSSNLNWDLAHDATDNSM